MATVELCIDGSGTARHDASREELREILRDPKSLVWITIDRSREELDRLGEILGFHDLAIEDATEDDERPKASVYTDHIFMLLYSLERREGKLASTPVSFFIGRNYLVTVTDERPASLKDVAHRWRSQHERIAERDPGTLAYALIDSIVDDYFPLIDTIGEELEDLETSVMEHKAAHPQARIHDLRVELLRLRRVIGPEREAINVLLRRDAPLFGRQTTDYLEDVYDHLLRVLDWLDLYRDVLSNLSDLQISVASHRLDRTMRTMTAWSIIFMATTLIAGIYGMNFHHMPELGWRWGYPASLIAMAGLGIGMFIFFRKRKWL
ncbi:MAG: magnesium/cobalt transporter CorA [Thermomicrobiales bacterium]